MAIPEAFNLNQWLKDNEKNLVPPVNNKELFPDDENFIVMAVGGPNVRHDFHYEPYPEWFYQIKGNMHVNIMEDGKVRRIDIKEGETWLLPPYTPHSPQRPEEGSLGLVVEMVRPEGVTEEFHWYCLECDTLVHKISVQLEDIAKDLPPLFEAFYATSDEDRTCTNCGAVHPGKAVL